MPSHYLNDVSSEDRGLSLAEGGPIMPFLSVQREQQAWPGRAGPLMAPYATVAASVKRFVWNGTALTVAARNAVIESLLDDLTGAVEVRDRDTPTRATRGTTRVFEASVPSPSFVNVEPKIVVEIECPNQAWDLTSQSCVIGSTPVPIPCGTLSHGGQFYLTGVAAGAISTEVRIRYRGITGTLLGELVVLPSLASGEHAVIDLDSAQIVKVTTGNVRSNVDSWITGGDFFKFYPRDSSRTASVWATLETTAGAVLYTFRRSWLA